MMGFKQLRSGHAFALFASLILLSACNCPTRDKSTLKAIKTEAEILMKQQSAKGAVRVPKGRWPSAIASLKPELVTIRSDGVYILTKAYFDGGWGYFIPLNEQESPQPEGRFWAVGQGVYWFHPY